MKQRYLLLWILILAALIFPRFDRIERPVTVDELTWLTFSADFYRGLGRGEFEYTYQDHHPGVTTMWAGTAAYLIEYRAYRATAPAYYANDTAALIDFLEGEGIEIGNILLTARRIMAAACVIGLALAFYFLWRLFEPLTAFAAIMFIALDPFVIGQTRLFSHEGLMSVLVLLAWLSFYHYFRDGRKTASLLVSGIAAGLAVLTKVTALGLLPMVGIFWLVEVFRIPRSERKLWEKLWPLLAWGVLLMVVFYALWPAAWTDPVGRVAYMIEHTRGFSGETSAGFDFSGALSRTWDYHASIWSHATLLTWAGVLAFAIFGINRKKGNSGRGLAGFSLIYILVVVLTVAVFVSSIKGSRYMASVHIFLALIAGVGAGMALDWFSNLPSFQSRSWAVWVILGVLLIAQIGMITPAAPYYYTYNQPLKTDVWWGVHGAFLDQAGEYLAEKPGAEDLVVTTFSPGSLMFFFPGETRLLVPNAAWSEAEARNLGESDYLVFNYELVNLQPDQRPRIVGDILAADTSPEHTIEFQGRTLVWIYAVDDLPEAVFAPD